LRDVALTAGLPKRAVAALRAIAADGGDPERPIAEYARNALSSHHAWLSWREQRSGYQRAFRALFEHCDVLLCPVSALPAIAHDHSEPMGERRIHINGSERPYGDLFTWITPASVCGLPATVIQIGQTAGLPVGIQIIGPYLEDLTAIDFAGRLSDLLGGFVPPPGY
jgi:amidase